MHGPSECLGNMILLCAARIYPAPKLSLGFANCLVDDYDDIPDRDLVQSCALEYGLDFDRINACLSGNNDGGGGGGDGGGDDDDGNGAQELLRESVDRSARAHVVNSCTVRLQGEFWCVTGGETDCNDGANLAGLVEAVEKKYDEING
jgi:hypothetical protein